MVTEAVKFVDARGLKCPLPVLRLRREANGFTGSVKLVTDDPAALVDVPAFCAERGWGVAAISHEHGVVIWEVRVP